jgi:DNA-directed RNA polymerase subunit RPC12/RpoP
VFIGKDVQSGCIIEAMKEENHFMELWKALPKEVQDELARAVEESSATSPEEFAWEIFVGACPHCGSKETRDCEEIGGIEDVTIGLCNKCGYLWCTECGRSVVKGVACEHWGICEECLGKKGKVDDCVIPTSECPKVSFCGEPEDEETIYICAWCNKEIEKDAEVFGLGARTRKGLRLPGPEGSPIQIPLRHIDRLVPAIIPERKSEAKKAGNEVLFMICSKKCGELLKKALLKEKFRIV